MESVLPRTSAEVANFVDQFVRGRSEAFNRILRKINADLAGYSKLQTGPCEFTTTPVRTRIL